MHDLSTAGTSAQVEYDRRAAREAATRAHLRRLKVAIVIVTPIVVFFAVRYGAHAMVNSFLGSTSIGTSTAASTEATPPTPLPTEPFTWSGVLLAIVATLRMRAELVGRRQTTEAWAKGAAGERLTAATLSRLSPDFVVLHDLPIPRSRANIDHVVVGPTGVFIIETKNYSHPVTIQQGVARSGRYPLGKVVEQAKRQAELMTSIAGEAAVPIVAVQSVGIQLGFLAKPVVQGVRFASNRFLLDALLKRPIQLQPWETQVIADRIRAGVGRTTR